MNVIIDTNILLISLPSLSPYHEIVKAFNRKLYQLVVTTAIFLEYEEILSERANPVVANDTLSAFLQASNVVSVNTYFNWNLISVDPDDNKFTDAYISGNADYLVTHDSHFNVLKKTRFPKINTITADDFLLILKRLENS
jgi:putative PIN family toxin of toxin-antitoxin system